MKIGRTIVRWLNIVVFMFAYIGNAACAQSFPEQYRSECNEKQDAEIWYQYYFDNGALDISGYKSGQKLAENEYYSMNVDFIMNDGFSVLSAVRLTPKSNTLLWNHYYPGWGIDEDISNSLNEFLSYSNAYNAQMIDVDASVYPSNISDICYFSDYYFINSPIPTSEGGLIYLDRTIYDGASTEYNVSSLWELFPKSGALEDVTRSESLKCSIDLPTTAFIDSREYVVNKEIEDAGIFIQKLSLTTTPIACYLLLEFSTVDNRYSDYQLIGPPSEDGYVDADPYLMIRLDPGDVNNYSDPIPTYFSTSRLKVNNNTYQYRFVCIPDNPNEGLPTEYEVVVWPIGANVAYENSIVISVDNAPKYLLDVCK